MRGRILVHNLKPKPRDLAPQAELPPSSHSWADCNLLQIRDNIQRLLSYLLHFHCRFKLVHKPVHQEDGRTAHCDLSQLAAIHQFAFYASGRRATAILHETM
jgi:hypothetical protein